MTTREFIDSGDRVIVLGNDMGKARATSTMVDTPYVHILELKNGKVTRFEEFEDTATINQATMPIVSAVS